MTGTFQAPGAVPMAKISNEAVSEQRAQLAESMQDIATGDMSMGAFKKIMKRFGWTGDPQTGKLVDPMGQEHDMRLEAEAK
jgi:hypothetical protein